MATHQQTRLAEGVNAKVYERSIPLNAKKGGSQLQTKNIIGAVSNKLCLSYILYIESCVEDVGSRFWIILY